MNTITKIGIAAGVVTLAVWGWKAAKEAANGFAFNVVGYGKPTMQGHNVTVPLQIRYTNPTPLPINVDNLRGDIYLNKYGTFIKAAVIDQPVSLQPGTSEQWIFPVLNLQNVFGGDVNQTIAAIAEILGTKKMTIRSDVSAKYGVISIPTQSFTNTIDL